jgi:dTDP-4-dehydrorhamnose reductase
MKVLILGADGMIGHKMAQSLSEEHGLEVILNSRSNSKILSQLYPKCKVYEYDFLKDDINNLLDIVTPDLIINAIGITIRRGADNINKASQINSVFPHKIDKWVSKFGKRLIHFSTDCVYSGKKGDYLDYDIPDAEDNYGKTKADGEINSENTLTIRSSMIGREMFNKTELMEWILSNKNKKICGFKNVVYSGVTSLWMSKTVVKIIKEFPSLNGIYNISSEPISKFDLISKINNCFELNIDIEADNSFFSNKSLNSSKFFLKTNLEKPNWDKMLLKLYNDSVESRNIYNLK